jgi:ribokinase
MSELNVKVITFGAGTQDVFLMGKALTAKRDVRTHDYVEVFPLGAKLELDNVIFDVGGGATNAAVTFARQGFRTEFIGKIGHDPAGTEILRVLKKEAVSTDRVAVDPRLSSGYSVLLLAPSGERTVLVHRGAAHELGARDMDIRNLDADWFYISSLAGNFDLAAKLIKHAKAHGIKVAWNPGSAELKKARKVQALLANVEVLLANTQEMKEIFGGNDAKDIMTRAFGVCPYVVMTDGAKGTYATDSNKIYFAGLYQNVKVIDRTGAGDAFGSGFVAALAKQLPIEDALTLASANASAVVAKIGAKTGILHTQKLRRMNIKAISL